MKKQKNKTIESTEENSKDFFLYNDYLDEEILREVIGVNQENFKQNNCLTENKFSNFSNFSQFN